MGIREDIRKLKEQMIPAPKPVIKWTFNPKEVTNEPGAVWVLFTL